MKFLVPAVAAALLPALTLAADREQPLDAEVTTSGGAKTRLKAYFGKPVLLFYEDPDSVRLNQRAKDELARLSTQWSLSGKIDVVAVANLEAFNWQPALFFALLAVRSEEQKAKVPVLVDLTGELSRAPWSLSAKRSSIVLLSARGQVLFEAVGLLDRARLDELIGALTRLLLAPPAES